MPLGWPHSRVVKIDIRLSQHRCICHDKTDASGCRCTPVSCQYKVSLGQPKVNLGQRDFRAALVGLWVTETGLVLVVIKLAMIIFF